MNVERARNLAARLRFYAAFWGGVVCLDPLTYAERRAADAWLAHERATARAWLAARRALPRAPVVRLRASSR